ncbi:AraC family transcriptional regulator [Paenibacillus antri]|nr:AraC family transcriptional regulator [Paenibacillus antri]
MTHYPGYLKTYPNMHAPFPFHLGLHRLTNGFRAHRHDFLEFSYVVEGSGSETIDGVNHPMVPGTFTFILPYQVHELFTDPGSTLVLYNCNFGMDLLYETGMSGGFGELFAGLDDLPAYARLQGEAMEEMRVRIEEMYRETMSTERWRDTLLKAKLAETLVRFDRYRHQSEAAPETSGATASVRPPRSGKSSVWAAVHYIHNNYQEDLSLSDLARRFSLSASRMSEVIKEATGQTFVRFVHDLRLRQAASLLVSTDMSVTDIVHEVGFGSYKTFARMFKEAKGISPTDYRKSKRGRPAAVRDSFSQGKESQL